MPIACIIRNDNIAESNKDVRTYVHTIGMNRENYLKRQNYKFKFYL